MFIHAHEFKEEEKLHAETILHQVVKQLDSSGQYLKGVSDTGTNRKLQCICSVSLVRFYELHVQQAIAHKLRRMGDGNQVLTNDERMCICLEPVKSEYCIECVYCCVNIHTECVERLLKEINSQEHEILDLEADSFFCCRYLHDMLMEVQLIGKEFLEPEWSEIQGDAWFLPSSKTMREKIEFGLRVRAVLQSCVQFGKLTTYRK